MCAHHCLPDPGPTSAEIRGHRWQSYSTGWSSTWSSIDEDTAHNETVREYTEKQKAYGKPKTTSHRQNSTSRAKTRVVDFPVTNFPAPPPFPHPPFPSCSQGTLHQYESVTKSVRCIEESQIPTTAWCAVSQGVGQRDLSISNRARNDTIGMETFRKRLRLCLHSQCSTRRTGCGGGES